MISVIQHFPFGMLVSAHDGTPFVTHIPIIYDEPSGRLVAHIDKQNPQVATLREGASVMAIFKGPDAYISPSVYLTDQLPTWNYIIVHLTGTVRVIEESNRIKETLVNMTRFLEGPEQKFQLKKDHPMLEHLLPHIQVFEIEITHWEGKFKLSQDKNLVDFECAKAELIKNSKTDLKSFIEKIYKT